MGKKANARKARQDLEAIERFYYLCCNGDLKGVRAALKDGLDVNCEFHEMRGLMAAVIYGRNAVVCLLLKQEGIEVDIVGADLDDQHRGLSLLMVAVERDNVDCVKLLIDAGADPNIKDPPYDEEYEGFSPLMWAVRHNQVDCVKLLLADPRVDLMTRDGYKRSEGEVARFVEDLKRPVLEVLEECIWDENSQLFQLRGFWNSGVKVKSRILGELEAYWRRLALQGRSLEEAARARCLDDWRCHCRKAEGHPELAVMVEEERQRRKIELLHLEDAS